MRGVHGLYRCRKIVKAIDDYIYLFIDLLFMYVFEHLKPIKHGYDIGFWIRDASMSQSVQLLRKEKKKAFNHFIPMDK